MTYPERNHPTADHLLSILPKGYEPHVHHENGTKAYGVLLFIDGKWKVKYQTELPSLGGYIAKESIYGSPTYCPNATRHHKRHLKLYGFMPHLIYFADEETAVKAGFRKCKKCI